MQEVGREERGMSMSEIEKTCENCEYEHEDLEGTHCRHCIHNAEEHFKQKEIHYTEQEIRNKVIDEFAEKLIMHFADWKMSELHCVIVDTIDQAMEGVNEIAEQMKGV